MINWIRQHPVAVIGTAWVALMALLFSGALGH